MPLKFTIEKEVNELLQKAGKENKALLAKLISFLKEEEIKKLNENPKLLKFLLDNLKQKEKALRDKDKKKLDEILKQEVDFAERLSKE